MTDWFARPILHVRDVDASIRFYVDLLGFTSPWRYDEEGRRESHKSIGRVALSSWPTISPRRRLARG